MTKKQNTLDVANVRGRGGHNRLFLRAISSIKQRRNGKTQATSIKTAKGAKDKEMERMDGYESYCKLAKENGFITQEFRKGSWYL